MNERVAFVELVRWQLRIESADGPSKKESEFATEGLSGWRGCWKAIVRMETLSVVEFGDVLLCPTQASLLPAKVL